jgi:hypothetical protein
MMDVTECQEDDKGGLYETQDLSGKLFMFRYHKHRLQLRFIGMAH